MVKFDCHRMNFVWKYAFFVIQIFGGFPYLKSSLGHYRKNAMLMKWGCFLDVTLTSLNLCVWFHQFLQLHFYPSFEHLAVLIMLTGWYGCMQVVLTTNTWRHDELNKILGSLQRMKPIPKKMSIQNQLLILFLCGFLNFTMIVYPDKSTDHFIKTVDNIEGWFYVCYIVIIFMTFLKSTNLLEAIVEPILQLSMHELSQISNNEVEIIIKRLIFLKSILKQLFIRHKLDFALTILSFCTLLIFYMTIMDGTNETFDYWSYTFGVVMGIVIFLPDISLYKVSVKPF